MSGLRERQRELNERDLEESTCKCGNVSEICSVGERGRRPMRVVQVDDEGQAM